MKRRVQVQVQEKEKDEDEGEDQDKDVMKGGLGETLGITRQPEQLGTDPTLFEVLPVPC